MQASRRNQRYLPLAPLPESLTLSAAPLAPLAAGSDLVIIGTPMAALRATLAALADLTVPVAWLCKGFERVADADAGQGLHGLLAHEIAEQVAPLLAVGTLSGPSFAREVAEAKPTALVAASQQASVRQALVEAHAQGRLAMQQHDMEAYDQANLRLHQLVLEGAHNAHLTEAARALRTRVKPFRRGQFTRFDRLVQSYEEHSRVVEAVLAHDALAAHREMRAHLQAARQATRLLAPQWREPSPAA